MDEFLYGEQEKPLNLSLSTYNKTCAFHSSAYVCVAARLTNSMFTFRPLGPKSLLDVQIPH